MNIVVDDLLTTYQLTGKGKLVVLLHGWGDNARGLAALQATLAANYQVLAIDLPGFGNTQAPKEPWDLDNYGAFLASTLKKLDLKQPYALLGHSNGASVAIRAISLGLVSPKKLIVLAGAGIRTTGGPRRAALKAIAKVGNLATLWMPERYRKGLRKSLYGAAGSDMLVVPELQETFKRSVRQDVQADAAKIDIPALLLYAENDRAVPVGDGEIYHRLMKHSQLKIIPAAGHFVHIDAPDAVSQAIMEFLK